jgi:hypothetical protein
VKPRTNGLEPFSLEEEQKIIRDCVKAARNIDDLTDKAYRFLNLSNGFIAHYDRFGFMDNYREPGSLKQDILDYQNENQWGNFRSGERGYEYYMQKKNIYNAVCDYLKNNIEYRPKRNVEKTIEARFWTLMKHTTA